MNSNPPLESNNPIINNPTNVAMSALRFRESSFNPFLSNIIIFFLGTFLLINKFAHAIADAPAPLITIFIFLISFLVICTALINAAVVIIAVPC